jgi:hypothetical protein
MKQRNETTAQDSYRGKLYFAFSMGLPFKGLMNDWVRIVVDAVSWSLELTESETWGSQEAV